MKKALLGACLSLIGFLSFSQEPVPADKTLLWKISGGNTSQASYLFGTIHMLCANELQLSDNLKNAIAQSSQVFLEIDMDNMDELTSVMTRMKMNGDTTLQDLLSVEEYAAVKNFFHQQGTPIPFSMLEKYKPLLAASSVMEGDIDCLNPISMEQLIMEATKEAGKKIKGLETIAFQMSIFDSIPYKIQAQQLYSYVNNYGKNTGKKDYEELASAYMQQDLEALEAITLKDDMGIANFMEVLLYNRNRDWVKKLQTILPAGSVVIAVGAGHLPGEQGVIALLRKAGYTIEPMANNMMKGMEKPL